MFPYITLSILSVTRSWDFRNSSAEVWEHLSLMFGQLSKICKRITDNLF